MAVQYGIRRSLWAALWSRKPKLRADDPIHEMLRQFGAIHERFEMLTESVPQGLLERNAQQGVAPG